MNDKHALSARAVLRGLIRSNPEKWIGAPQILHNLDLLALKRFGLLYCDRSTGESG